MSTKKHIQYFFKRSFDYLFSLTLLLMLSPLFLLLMLLLRISIGQNVFFIQERPGRNGNIFKIKKFRTMNNKKDENGELLPDGERLTKVGGIIRKLSLDEIPQLLNVFKGEMSFVGPRPLLKQYMPLYSDRQRKRHDVLPGITGWAQVNGRNSISWKEKFEYDVWYVENWSLLLDFKILLLTIEKVFKRQGVSQEGNATMEAFTGNN
ncbi:MAG: lipid carrier--UDP-N-acetylgalactosaminyltransferase [Halobacteriovoraceae bacterium]|nr:lipid carrier--UDP-N-acetylgalactosaminyltransferase [Halobacteriovoraceae bacterium]|tara:strand:+ start:20624 stop:21244 length:621 start_codon:yes stop_codon:yes gene_type:complete